MAKKRCAYGTCEGKPTKAGWWFCHKCGYNTGRPHCYRFGCKKPAVVAIIDKLAITPYKPACEEHKAGAKFRR